MGGFKLDIHRSSGYMTPGCPAGFVIVRVVRKLGLFHGFYGTYPTYFYRGEIIHLLSIMNIPVPSGKLTYPLKMDAWKMNFFLKWSFFQGTLVNFQFNRSHSPRHEYYLVVVVSNIFYFYPEPWGDDPI